MSPIRARSSKKPTDQRIGGHRSVDRWFLPIALAFRENFPAKTAEVLADLAGLKKVRPAELWLSGRRAPNGEALARLIASKHGDLVIRALTAGSGQVWVKRHLRIEQLAKARAEVEAATRRLAEAERGIEP
ncbi:MULTISPECIES: hypothetical protein [unclassified Bradyrhizobium]|uniref:hypothetical protein n=1 Tax=unclassified Bradyrhizobium TaxID=2631580 RepID=UPI001BABFC51|nr:MULTISPECIES: hypothetical protein [unclassified Bradyrhizobium]MBR1206987.1 hypothetical protein [Bradyrhizobium sp. AUGA SZCCT0124]MBR1313526.1 hypothetical protein [Bradyrhizobium sp. AUGA SZCCT0051]MBR1343377.1 hypothetical protein [Bradyrhizobium sp. AUGA SZCCT0105]MBR1357203.1 hypothetical protein [Bradyrhizobium sp. AUGA SZCCT0045]